MDDYKIVLAVKGYSALYAYKEFGRLEYVVANWDGQEAPKVGDNVKGWSRGNYFQQDLNAALNYLGNCY